MRVCHRIEPGCLERVNYQGGPGTDFLDSSFPMGMEVPKKQNQMTGSLEPEKVEDFFTLARRS